MISKLNNENFHQRKLKTGSWKAATKVCPQNLNLIHKLELYAQNETTAAHYNQNGPETPGKIVWKGTMNVKWHLNLNWNNKQGTIVILLLLDNMIFRKYKNWKSLCAYWML